MKIISNYEGVFYTRKRQLSFLLFKFKMKICKKKILTHVHCYTKAILLSFFILLQQSCRQNEKLVLYKEEKYKEKQR